MHILIRVLNNYLRSVQALKVCFMSRILIYSQILRAAAWTITSKLKLTFGLVGFASSRVNSARQTWTRGKKVMGQALTRRFLQWLSHHFLSSCAHMCCAVYPTWMQVSPVLMQRSVLSALEASISCDLDCSVKSLLTVCNVLSLFQCTSAVQSPRQGWYLFMLEICQVSHIWAHSTEACAEGKRYDIPQHWSG